MPLKMNGRVPPEMTGRSNLGTATYISWNVPPEMGDKCQYHLIWVAALPTVHPERPQGTTQSHFILICPNARHERSGSRGEGRAAQLRFRSLTRQLTRRNKKGGREYPLQRKTPTWHKPEGT